MRSTPNRAIRVPVKKLGRNMATACHWITQLDWLTENPQFTMAIGLAVITRLMTPYEIVPQATAATSLGWRTISRKRPLIAGGRRGLPRDTEKGEHDHAQAGERGGGKIAADERIGREQVLGLHDHQRAEYRRHHAHRSAPTRSPWAGRRR